MLPFAPAVAVMGKVMIAKLAATVQSPVIAPVVYTFPDNVPLHPVTEDMEYPKFGVTVNCVLAP